MITSIIKREVKVEKGNENYSNTELTQLFVKSIFDEDIDLLSEILDDNSLFFEGISKVATLTYFMQELKFEIPSNLYWDYVQVFECRGCLPWSTALCFHNGVFPQTETKENGIPVSTVLSTENGKITDLTICSSFCGYEKLIELYSKVIK